MADPRADPAIGAGEHVFAADQPGIAHQPLGDEIGMLDEIGAMADDAGDQGGARRQFRLLEDAPLMLVAGIGGLDGEAARLHAKDQVDDVTERDVVVVRAVVAAPADM